MRSSLALPVPTLRCERAAAGALPDCYVVDCFLPPSWWEAWWHTRRAGAPERQMTGACHAELACLCTERPAFAELLGAALGAMRGMSDAELRQCLRRVACASAGGLPPSAHSPFPHISMFSRRAK